MAAQLQQAAEAALASDEDDADVDALEEAAEEAEGGESADAAIWTLTSARQLPPGGLVNGSGMSGLYQQRGGLGQPMSSTSATQSARVMRLSINGYAWFHRAAGLRPLMRWNSSIEKPIQISPPVNPRLRA